MLTFYPCFLPHLATILQSLPQLLKKGQIFRWSNNQEWTFNEAMELRWKAPVLTHYDVHKPLLLTCDASSYGVGALLAHQIEDWEHLIAFHFRTMAPVEKEALAMICSVRKFYKYLWGRYFNIYTDHKRLCSARWIETSSATLLCSFAEVGSSHARLWARVSAWRKHSECRCIEQTATEKMVEVPLLEPVLNLLQHLDEGPLTNTDPVMSRVLHELSCEDWCILWGVRVILPLVHCFMLMEELYETHRGILRMKSLARNYVWWPSVDINVATMVNHCHSCQINQYAPAKAPLHPWEYTANPWSRFLRVLSWDICS